MDGEPRFTLHYRDKALRKYEIRVSKLYEHPEGKSADEVVVRIKNDSGVCATF